MARVSRPSGLPIASGGRRVRLAIATLLFAAHACACDTLVPPGRAPVAVAKETAIVLWDRDTRTERFIRTATFTGTDGPMAFLVPTPAPAPPRLTALNTSNVEIAHEVFNDDIAPRIVTRRRTVYRRGWSRWASAGR